MDFYEIDPDEMEDAAPPVPMAPAGKPAAGTLAERVTTVGWDDLDAAARGYLKMRKDVCDGVYGRKWPSPGSKLSIELIAEGDRSLRFFLDVIENKRSTALIIGLSPNRKCTMQTRKSDRPLMRIDYSTLPGTLRHRNPDGTLVCGPHVHLDLDGTGARWAFPVEEQEIVVPGQPGVTPLFWAFQESCGITEKLRIEQSLGV